MKKEKELEQMGVCNRVTQREEGVEQRECAIANRVVHREERVESIEVCYKLVQRRDGACRRRLDQGDTSRGKGGAEGSVKQGGAERGRAKQRECAIDSRVVQREERVESIEMCYKAVQWRDGTCRGRVNHGGTERGKGE